MVYKIANYPADFTLQGLYDKQEHENILQKIDTKSIDGLNSIVNNKNNIAHGKVSNATVGDIMGYHQNALKIFEVLEKILLS
ncbi:hypothetical protein J7K55_06775 [Candidatus Aerophobetes bacterium]|nr:hypothetical protein [Candidatus Aerophobetes bacterium]